MPDFVRIMRCRFPKARAIVAAFLASSALYYADAISAEISSSPPAKNGDAAIITIDGDINFGDDAKFRKMAAEYSDAIVLLNSDGGMIAPAMDIGRTIKLRGYMTAIYDHGACASACALIWVAGSRRFISEDGQVGFHASYLDTDGKKLAAGVGNALVGHYLSQLGFGEKTVIFATLAPPEKILWLSRKNAQMSGIDFETISENNSEDSRVADSAPAPASEVEFGESRGADYSTFMADSKQNLRNPEAISEALRGKGFQTKLIKEDSKLPKIEIGVGGGKIMISFSGCDAKGCDYVELIDLYTNVSKEQARSVITKYMSEEFYSHPLWIESKAYLTFYTYIILGGDGVTVDTLIASLEYFVKTNKELLDSVVQSRSK